MNPGSGRLLFGEFFLIFEKIKDFRDGPRGLLRLRHNMGKKQGPVNYFPMRYIKAVREAGQRLCAMPRT